MSRQFRDSMNVFREIKNDLRSVLPIIFVAVLLFIMLFIATFLINMSIAKSVINQTIRRSQETAVDIETTTKSLMTSSNMIGAEELLRSNPSLQKMVEAILRKDDSIKYIEVEDIEGRTIIKISSESYQPNMSYNRKLSIEMVENSAIVTEKLTTFVERWPNPIVDLSVPINIDQKRIGNVRLGLSLDKQRQMIKESNVHVVNITTIAAALGSLILLVVLIYTIQTTHKLQRLENMRRESEKMAYVGELASGLAHEVRNPLNAISINLQMAQEDLEDERRSHETKEMLHKIQSEILDLEETLTNYLRFAKSYNLELAPIDIHDLVLQVVESLQAKVKLAGVSLKIENKLSCEKMYLDGRLIRQALYNLILNSVQAIPDRQAGAVIIRLTRPRKKIQIIEVIDNGCGIPESNRNKIFRIFFTTKQEGTGVGLATVYKIIREHEGEIEVESLADSGTTMRILLPISGEQNKA